MGALKYIKGGLRNLLNPGVSFLSRIDDVSEVSPKAKVYGKTQIYQSQIDDYSYVASGTQVICTEIGKFCSIADDVILGPGIHTLSQISSSSFEITSSGKLKSYIALFQKENIRIEDLEEFCC